MKKKEALEDFSLDELKTIRNCLVDYSSLDSVIENISAIIAKKEEEMSINPNVRFNMKAFIEWSIFDPEDLKILQINGINNLQELIDCNLDNLEGMTISSYRRLSWARSFYDMSKYVKNSKKDSRGRNGK